MCTLSWLPAGDSYDLFFNRDELRTRQAAVPPTVHRSGGTAFIAPIDPESGGSWIAVTESGLTFCLLNRHEDETPLPEIVNRRSRGEIIMHLGAGGFDRVAAQRWWADQSLSRFFPFTLAAVDGTGISRLDWDGTSRRSDAVNAAGLVHTSSSREPQRTIANRTNMFSHLGRVDAAGLRSVHASHTPARSAASVCMHRDDASTVSFTEVRVGPDRVTMEYQEGSPCSRGRRFAVGLSRRSARALG